MCGVFVHRLLLGMWILEDLSSRRDRNWGLEGRKEVCALLREMDDWAWFLFEMFVLDYEIASTIRISQSAISRQHVCLEVDNHYDASEPSSVMKLSIQDMKTKHGSKWNQIREFISPSLIVAFNAITLTKADESGVLSLTSSYSFRYVSCLLCDFYE